MPVQILVARTRHYASGFRSFNANLQLMLHVPSQARQKPHPFHMVKQHSSKDSFDDMIQGKGKGIVCLFSGLPTPIQWFSRRLGHRA